MNGCSLGHNYVYWPMMTGPGAVQPPCPCCKERDRADAAEAKVIELTGVVDTKQNEIDRLLNEMR